MLNIKPIIDALNVHASQYSSGGADYSVTTLLNPPRVVHLQKRHGNEKTINYAALMPSFIGTGVHEYVESCLRKSKGYDLERRLFMDVAERKVSGAFDIYADNQIWDIKTCKTWKLVFDPEAIEWTEQQNCYAHMLRAEGCEVKQLNIIAIYLDWLYGKNERDRSYPPSPVCEYQLNLWSDRMVHAFMVDKVETMKEFEETPDNELPVCSQEERFEDPTKFACYKSEDFKRATKLFDNVEEAKRYMTNTKGFGSSSYIEVRPAIRKRCERYCEISSFCNVYREYKERQDRGSLNWVLPYDQI